MSREIKFRAWDQKKKEMLYGVSPFALLISDEKAPLLSPKASRNEDCVFEQYTGLRDKNGKEIYEGDIVKISNFKPIFEVKYSTYFAEFLMEANGELYEEFQYWNVEKAIEVIGNIHESPELLGGEDA